MSSLGATYLGTVLSWNLTKFDDNAHLNPGFLIWASSLNLPCLLEAFLGCTQTSDLTWSSSAPFFLLPSLPSAGAAPPRPSPHSPPPPPWPPPPPNSPCQILPGIQTSWQCAVRSIAGLEYNWISNKSQTARLIKSPFFHISFAFLSPRFSSTIDIWYQKIPLWQRHLTKWKSQKCINLA